MARLTVEDCLAYVENRFDLILKASKRARLIERGAEPMVDWENDKPTVIALREIANGLLDTSGSESKNQTAEAEKDTENVELLTEQKETSSTQAIKSNQEEQKEKTI